MAPGTPKQLAVRLPENEEVARILLEKRRSMVEKGISENMSLTLSTAYRNVCAAREPIRTLKDLLKIKGVGPWVVRLVKGSFPESSPDLSPPKSNAAEKKGKKTRGPVHYVPEENSAGYAILIALYREMISGKNSMEKKDIIDAAEASGLLRKAIGLDQSNAKPGSSGGSQKDQGTGWSCMVPTLISRRLVVKSGKPPKYMLTEEGKDTARVCLSRSGLEDPPGPLMITNAVNTSTAYRNSDNLFLGSSVADIPLGPLMTVSRPSTFVAGQSPEPVCRNSATITSQELIQFSQEQLRYNSEGSAEFNMLDKDTACMDNSILAMPPGQSSEKFLEAYEVVLILDDRENFGSRSKRVVDNIHSQFHVPVEMKRLPVGDCIWIARHRKLHTGYVLDFIVERKKVTDLVSSIKDSRYRDQKLRLKKCGLRKLIYLVEGDPNPLDASESIKTACFTTEILEGFDVQRTTGYSDTERTYGYLTRSIIDYYSTNFSAGANTSRVCLTYDEFVKKCNDPKKLTVSALFALQLMQVPQVTEETALAVTELYPTLFSLARAYSMLDGDTCAQEGMLKKKSRMVNAGASRNIFKLVWGEG